jgi:hypothetical protein
MRIPTVKVGSSRRTIDLDFIASPLIFEIATFIPRRHGAPPLEYHLCQA